MHSGQAGTGHTTAAIAIAEKVACWGPEPLTLLLRQGHQLAPSKHETRGPSAQQGLHTCLGTSTVRLLQPGKAAALLSEGPAHVLPFPNPQGNFPLSPQPSCFLPSFLSSLVSQKDYLPTLIAKSQGGRGPSGPIMCSPWQGEPRQPVVLTALNPPFTTCPRSSGGLSPPTPAHCSLSEPLIPQPLRTLTVTAVPR